MSKKRVLICLYGLPRTFRETYSSLFANIIRPNSDRYEFDIVINTDAAGHGLTHGRPDTSITGRSAYSTSIEQLSEDLMRCYNRDGASVKMMQFYNFKPSAPIGPWFVVFARLQQILAAVHKEPAAPSYDIYMAHRIDTVFTRSLNLDTVSDKLLFITYEGRRPYFFHDRDVIDTTFVGPREQFMRWIWTTIKVAHNISKRTTQYSSLYTYDSIWPGSAAYEAEFIRAQVDPLKVFRDIGANHSSASTEDALMTDTGIVRKNVITIADNDMRPYLLDAWARCLSLIKPIFSESLHPPLHTQIIR